MAAKLGYGNLAGVATLGGGSWDADYPLDNLKNRRLFKKARSASTSATITISLPSAASIGIVALCSHNLTAAATVRVQGTTFDSGTNTIYPGEDYAVIVDPAEASASWTITVADSGNGAGYVEFGRLFIGPTFSPATCVDWGFSEGVESRSNVVEALAGPEYFDIRGTRRIWSGKFSWLDDSEAAQFRTIMRQSDISQEIYWVPRPDLTTGQGDVWFLGRFRQLSAVEYPYLHTHAVGVEIQEIM